MSIPKHYLDDGCLYQNVFCRHKFSKPKLYCIPLRSNLRYLNAKNFLESFYSSFLLINISNAAGTYQEPELATQTKSDETVLTQIAVGHLYRDDKRLNLLQELDSEKLRSLEITRPDIERIWTLIDDGFVEQYFWIEKVQDTPQERFQCNIDTFLNVYPAPKWLKQFQRRRRTNESSVYENIDDYNGDLYICIKDDDEEITKIQSNAFEGTRTITVYIHGNFIYLM